MRRPRRRHTHEPTIRRVLAAASPPPRRLLVISSPLPRRFLAASFPPPFRLPARSLLAVCLLAIRLLAIRLLAVGLLAARPPPRCLSPRRPPASSPPTRLPHCPPASSPSASTFSRHADTPADTPRLLLASSRHILASSPHRLILTVLPHRHASMCLRSTSSHA